MYNNSDAWRGVWDVGLWRCQDTFETGFESRMFSSTVFLDVLVSLSQRYAMVKPIGLDAFVEYRTQS